MLKSGKPLIESVELIDRFEGNQLDVCECSMAFRLIFRGEKTLKENDINALHEKIRKHLIQKFGAKLRS